MPKPPWVAYQKRVHHRWWTRPIGEFMLCYSLVNSVISRMALSMFFIDFLW